MKRLTSSTVYYKDQCHVIRYYKEGIKTILSLAGYTIYCTSLFHFLTNLFPQTFNAASSSEWKFFKTVLWLKEKSISWEGREWKIRDHTPLHLNSIGTSEGERKPAGNLEASPEDNSTAKCGKPASFAMEQHYPTHRGWRNASETQPSTSQILMRGKCTS